MLSYKASTIAVVPVVLTVTATNLPHTGVAAGSVTVTVVKSNGVIVTYSPAGGQWTEFVWDAFAGSGYYALSIPVGSTDVAGILHYCVSTLGDDKYFGVVDIVANLEADTFGRVGLPAGASVSADIAAVAAKTVNLPAIPASQGDVAAIGVSIAEMMGLLHKNAVLEGQTYNAGGRLTNATLYVYDTNAHASLNDHITGLIHSYGIFATYDLADHQTSYTLQSLS